MLGCGILYIGLLWVTVHPGIAAEKESRSLFLEAGDASESLRVLALHVALVRYSVLGLFSFHPGSLSLSLWGFRV